MKLRQVFSSPRCFLFLFQESCESADDAIIDLVDFIYRKIMKLLLRYEVKSCWTQAEVKQLKWLEQAPRDLSSRLKT